MEKDSKKTDVTDVIVWVDGEVFSGVIRATAEHIAKYRGHDAIVDVDGGNVELQAHEFLTIEQVRDVFAQNEAVREVVLAAISNRGDLMRRAVKIFIEYAMDEVRGEPLVLHTDTVVSSVHRAFDGLRRAMESCEESLCQEIKGEKNSKNSFT